MYVMTKEEVSKYFFAKENLRRAEYETAYAIQDLYDDIHPTMTVYDSELGKMSCRSADVEELAIYIISMKARLQRDLNTKKRYLDCLKELLSMMNAQESCLFFQLKRNRYFHSDLINDIRFSEVKAKLTEIAYLQHRRLETLREIRDRRAEAYEKQVNPLGELTGKERRKQLIQEIELPAFIAERMAQFQEKQLQAEGG